MDDYSITSLTESKNEWCARLVSILTPTIIQGIKSIFDESIKLCNENDEDNKYLMTFQNLLSQIPQWNPNTIELERKRIEQVSGCKYLEELVTCVHIIQLKALSCIRVGQKQKKIDIDVPSIDKFIHQVYINTARKLYTNIYLFEKDLFPLQIQKNNRELEILAKEAILTTIRDNIPVEQILRVYMDETEEEEIENLEPNNSATENNLMADSSLNTLPIDSKNEMPENTISNETNKEMMDNNVITTDTTVDSKLDAIANEIANKTEGENNGEKLSIDFSDVDNVIESDNSKKDINAPKDLETLEKIAAINNEKRELENAEEQNQQNIKLDIGEDFNMNMDTINLSDSIELNDDLLLDDVEEL